MVNPQDHEEQVINVGLQNPLEEKIWKCNNIYKSFHYATSLRLHGRMNKGGENPKQYIIETIFRK